MLEGFVKIECFWSLTILGKSSTLDVWQGSEYASKYLPSLRKQLDSI